MRYLTKSRFKLACECETKLYYTRKPEYADQSVDDPFLLELAKGGYQVGELAKYYLTDEARNITVTEKDYEESLAETRRRIDRGDRLIAEAAVLYENLFIRLDILEINTESKIISLFEVKSKSWDSKTRFYTYNRISGEITGLNNDWKEYLYDVAFQKFVVSRAFPEYTVRAFLTVVNKDTTATVDGLNQFFKVKKTGSNYEVFTSPGLTKAQLGEPVLINLPVDDVIDKIWRWKIDSRIFVDYNFEDYVMILSDRYSRDVKINTPLSKECKKCQFYTKDSDKSFRSGLKECWMEKLGISETEFEKVKVTELWGGKAGARSIVQNLINKGRYFLDQVEPSDLDDVFPEKPEGELSASQRRWEQIRRVKNHDSTFYLDTEGLRDEMGKWVWPLHFIDFETSMPAIPFTKGAHPYEGIAFQYSHHTISKTLKNVYKIEHKNQFLKTDQGQNPNLDFIRELKRDLSRDNGTIFRYHRHENNYLREIYNQIKVSNPDLIPGRTELLSFIDSITENKINNKERRCGDRNMVDLWDLVVRYYYSPATHGSNSLKKVLPAVIHDSPFLKNKYSHAVCGRNREVTSLNFDSKIWIDEEYGNDPYKLLPPVFDNYSREVLDEMFEDMEEVADGGAAMMAYAKLQFFNTPDDQREAIRDALFKYCELDTLAMVMLWEFWNDQINHQVNSVKSFII